MTSTSGVYIDNDVLEVLKKASLAHFLTTFVFNLQVRRFDHFSHVRENDMMSAGLQPHQIGALREQIIKMSREMWNRNEPTQIYVNCEDANSSPNELFQKTLIPNSQIKVFEKLGEGSFAVVKKGAWTQNNGRTIEVAVKILRDISPAVLDDLKIEASHLLKLQHHSLIRLYGIVQQPAMMVFELCEGGSLLDRLRDDKNVLLVTQLLDYCIQISHALQFLETKHCVHRDVAARNILLTKDEKNVKICDFGLMRALKENEEMYTMGPQKKVPFAWCPPESLRHRKFSHASDVWSFGVTIWEIFTFGEEPWAGCRAVDVLRNYDNNETLNKPKYCSNKIYEIMQECWQKAPEMRIKFDGICEKLKMANFQVTTVKMNYDTIGDERLVLKSTDEVILIENFKDDFFGQCKVSRKFGLFPVAIVQSRSVVSAPVVKRPEFKFIPPPGARKTEKVPTIASMKSKISTPLQGSFIHTGHGGLQSWGNPDFIDPVYLKNPVAGAPLPSINGAEIIQSKKQLTNRRAAPLAPTLSLKHSNVRDEFEKACDYSFSPTEIEFARDYANEENHSPITVERPDIQFDIRGNMVTKKRPTMEPIPVNLPVFNNSTQSITAQKTEIKGYRSRPVSSSNLSQVIPRSAPVSTTCLVPTPAPTVHHNRIQNGNKDEFMNNMERKVQQQANVSKNESNRVSTDKDNIEARRSRIIAEMASVLPAPSAHLMGKSAKLSETSSVSISQNIRRSEPILTMNVLEPVKLPIKSKPALQPANAQNFSSTSHNTSSIPVPPRPSNIEDLSKIQQKMKILYQHASFTSQRNCNSMLAECKGNFELTLKRLKAQHLVTLGLAENEEKAKIALEHCKYNLEEAAANMCMR